MLVPFAEVDIRTSIRPRSPRSISGPCSGISRRVSPGGRRRRSGIRGGQGRRLRPRRGRRWRAPSSRCATPWRCRWSRRGWSCGRPGSARPSSSSGPTTTVIRTRSLAERLTPVVYDVGDLERFAAAAARRGRRVDVHVKVDTGMSRLGIARRRAPDRAGAPRRAARRCGWRGCAPTSRRPTSPTPAVTEDGARSIRTCCIGAARLEGFADLRQPRGQQRGGGSVSRARVSMPSGPGWRSTARCRRATWSLAGPRAGAAAAHARSWRCTTSPSGRRSATGGCGARRGRRASRRCRSGTPTAIRATSAAPSVLVGGRRVPDRRRRLHGHADGRRDRCAGRGAGRARGDLDRPRRRRGDHRRRARRLGRDGQLRDPVRHLQARAAHPARRRRGALRGPTPAVRRAGP